MFWPATVTMHIRSAAWSILASSAMRASLALAVLLLTGCATTQPDTPLNADRDRLGGLLANLDATPLPPRAEAETEGWGELSWTVRHALESAESRFHFAVAGDEVDVLTYGSARQAEGEGRRIAESIGDSQLAATEADSAPVLAAYFVVGRTLVRHRGADSTVTARLVAAFGEPTYLAGNVHMLVADGSAPETGLQLEGVCYRTPTACSGWGSGPYAAYLRDSLTHHTYRPFFFQSLYQGEHVPEWTVIRRPSAYDSAPPPPADND